MQFQYACVSSSSVCVCVSSFVRVSNVIARWL